MAQRLKSVDGCQDSQRHPATGGEVWTVAVLVRPTYSVLRCPGPDVNLRLDRREAPEPLAIIYY